MDTDELSEMAYGVIVQAAQISDTLKAELGALSSRYDIEEDWLYGVLKHLRVIGSDPEAYVEYWNLEEEEGVTASAIGKSVADLSKRVNEVLSTDFNKRGKREW